MHKYSITTLGCKVNQYESQQIRTFLESRGLKSASNGEKCDICIVNSCCVTSTASSKSRQALRQLLRSNPKGLFILCGCLAAVDSNELMDLPEERVHIVTNRNNLMGTLTEILDKIVCLPALDGNLAQTHNSSIRAKNELKIKGKSPILTELPEINRFLGQTRAFLKVQDGCDGMCRYCIIRLARPKLESKPLESVLHEAKNLVGAGHKEIVVTGIFLGAYGQKTVKRKKWAGYKNPKLAELVSEIAKIEGLERIRLSSLEPGDVSDELLEVFAKNRNIMPHFHLSIQSGSDNVLRSMARQYRRPDVDDVIVRIQSALDRPAITCDMIVGFPSERDEDFAETVELCNEAKFSKIHVFSYSPRPGTEAYDMKSVYKSGAVKKRSAKLRGMDKQLGREFREQFIGEVEEVLTEQRGREVMGRGRRYFEVAVTNAGDIGKNEIIKVRLTSNGDSYAIGEMI